MRATAVSAVVYIITCLALGVMTAHRGRSLVSKGTVTMPAGQQGPIQPLPDEPLDY